MAGKKGRSGAKTNPYPEGESWKTGVVHNADKRTVFVEWACTPKEARQPPTLRALAEELEVSEATIHNWKRHPDLAREIQRRTAQTMRVDQVPNILNALYERAMGDTGAANAAAKILLDHIKWTTEQLDEQQLDLSEMSLAELKDHIVGLYEEVEGREAS